MEIYPYIFKPLRFFENSKREKYYNVLQENYFNVQKNIFINCTSILLMTPFDKNFYSYTISDSVQE